MCIDNRTEWSHRVCILCSEADFQLMPTELSTSFSPLCCSDSWRACLWRLSLDCLQHDLVSLGFLSTTGFNYSGSAVQCSVTGWCGCVVPGAWRAMGGGREPALAQDCTGWCPEVPSSPYGSGIVWGNLVFLVAAEPVKLLGALRNWLIYKHECLQMFLDLQNRRPPAAIDHLSSTKPKVAAWQRRPFVLWPLISPSAKAGAGLGAHVPTELSSLLSLSSSLICMIAMLHLSTSHLPFTQNGGIEAEWGRVAVSWGACPKASTLVEWEWCWLGCDALMFRRLWHLLSLDWTELRVEGTASSVWFLLVFFCVL